MVIRNNAEKWLNNMKKSSKYKDKRKNVKINKFFGKN